MRIYTNIHSSLNLYFKNAKLQYHKHLFALSQTFVISHVTGCMSEDLYVTDTL